MLSGERDSPSQPLIVITDTVDYLVPPVVECSLAEYLVEALREFRRLMTGDIAPRKKDSMR